MSFLYLHLYNLIMKKHSYKWYISKKGWIFITANFLLGLSLTIWGIIRADDLNHINLRGLYIIWGIVIFMIFVSVFIGKATSTYFSPIFIDENGIKGKWLNKNGITFIEDNDIYINWNEISNIEYFDSSDINDIDTVRMKNHSGLRLFTETKKLIIYDNISNYSEINSYIKMKIDG